MERLKNMDMMDSGILKRVEVISTAIVSLRNGVQPDEKGSVELEKWRAEDNRNESLYNELIRKEYSDEEFKKFVSECVASDDLVLRRINRYNRRRSIQKRLAISVSAVAVVALFLAVFDTHVHPDFQQLALVSEDTSVYIIDANGYRTDIASEKTFDAMSVEAPVKNNDVRVEKITNNVVVVPYGKTFRMILIDGTSVWLNAGSRLSFPSKFTGDRREVTLVGQGYFEVVKDPEHPFIVNTSHLTTTVLGTSFMVSAYEDNNVAEVALVEGQVEVHTAGTGTILKEGFGVAYDIVKDEISEFSVDNDKIVATLNNKFLFKNERLESVMDALKRWYGVNVKFETDISRNLLFYIRTEKYDNIDQVMSLLKQTKNIDYIISDNTLIIK